jgi:hypothetical protein
MGGGMELVFFSLGHGLFEPLFGLNGGLFGLESGSGEVVFTE